MTPIELARLCAEKMTHPDARFQTVSLVIPKGKYPRVFPRGELLTTNRNGERVYLFEAEKLLLSLVKHGAIQATKIEQGYLIEEQHGQEEKLRD